MRGSRPRRCSRRRLAAQYAPSWAPPLDPTTRQRLDQAMAVALLAVDAQESDIVPFEVKAGVPFREFVVPAALLNRQATVTRLE